MSQALLSRPSLRARGTLRDELGRRRRSFRAGSPIQLSDGQMWFLPPHPKKAEPAALPLGADYSGLIRAILEAEDSSERCVAELALAIFLLETNYRLLPADYQRLLGSSGNRSGPPGWQAEFQEIARAHVCAFLDNWAGSVAN